MDRVNRTLLLSLKQEIKTLNEVVESIVDVCGESIEISSWLFPTKSYQFVNGLINDGFPEFEDFKSYLELIVDRLYVGIRLIVHYIETIIKEDPWKNRLIRRPKQLTLGFTFLTLWTAISITVENMSRTTTKETTTNEKNIPSIYAANKEIQTDIIALNKCDSCSAAMLCMKNLLQSLEDEKEDRNTRKQVLRPKIYDITQFGCMLQTTTSIENSLSSLFEKLFIKEQENEILLNENEKLKTDITNKFGKITLLEREVDILKEKYEKDSLKNILLSSQNENLVRTNKKFEFQINTLDEIIKNLNKSIQCYKAKMQILVQEKDSLYKSLDTLSETQRTLINLSTSVENKNCAIKDQYICIENDIKIAEYTVDSINSRLDVFTEVYSTVKNKMAIIHENMKESSCFIMSKSQDFLKCVKQHNITYLSKISNDNCSTFQIKGDPVEDLARQIEENNEKIKLLRKENDKLENIIKRFNRMK